MNPDELKFEAAIVGPEDGEAAQPHIGHARFTSFGLRFEGNDLKVEFPLEGLKVDWNPDDEEADLVFTHAQLRGWMASVSSDALEHPVFTRNFGLREQLMERKRRVEIRRRVRLCAGVLVVFAALSFVGWLVSRMAVGFILARVPVSYEVNLGEESFAEAQSVFLIDQGDTNRLERVTRLMQKLTAAQPDNPYDIRLHLVEDHTANAFAIPGGHVLVTTGLLKTAEDDDEALAGVLAHELAHVRHRHSLRQMITAGAPALLLRVVTGDNEGLLGALSFSFEFLLHQRFSRDLEREADESGWAYMVAAGMDPRGMIRMMEKFQEEEARMGSLPESLQPMNSHPPTRERLERLRGLWDTTPDKQRFNRTTGASPP